MVLYLCDGAVEGCKKLWCSCDLCHHTTDEKHAKYGKCEGSPEWFPERFYEMTKGMYVEKERY